MNDFDMAGAFIAAGAFSIENAIREQNYLLSLNEAERKEYFRQKRELEEKRRELKEKRRRIITITMLAVVLAAIGLFLGIWAFNLSL